MPSSFRQYRSEAASHSHDDFHQIIIADLGMLDLEIEGAGRLCGWTEIGLCARGRYSCLLCKRHEPFFGA